MSEEMVTVKIDQQELELPASVCKTDKDLRDALVQFYPGAANSDVKREQKGGRTVISVTKRAGSKGVLDALVPALVPAPESIHPVFRLDVEGPGRMSAEALDRVTLDALEEAAAFDRMFEVLDGAAAEASAYVPEGF